MAVSLAVADVDDDDHEEEAAAGRWGLVWDPEEGPVWGNMRDAEEDKQEDTWTQLLREGVSGITTDSNGGYRTCVWCFHTVKEKKRHKDTGVSFRIVEAAIKGLPLDLLII